MVTPCEPNSWHLDYAFILTEEMVWQVCEKSAHHPRDKTELGGRRTWRNASMKIWGMSDEETNITSCYFSFLSDWQFVKSPKATQSPNSLAILQKTQYSELITNNIWGYESAQMHRGKICGALKQQTVDRNNGRGMAVTVCRVSKVALLLCPAISFIFQGPEGETTAHIKSSHKQEGLRGRAGL